MSTLMDISLLITNILIVLGVAYMLKSSFIRPKQTQQITAAEIAEKLLEGLPYTIHEKGEHFTHYNFEFGHQHYALFIPNSGYEAHLYYYHFFVAPANEVALISSATNIVNTHTNNHAVSYTIDDESNEVVLMASSSILLNEGSGVKDTFFNILSDCWNIKDHFISVYNGMKAHSKVSDYTNPDIELAENTRELFYLRSHELWKQDFTPAEKYPSSSITLQEVLDFWEPTNGYQLQEVIYSANNELQKVSGDSLKNFTLLAPIISFQENQRPYLKTDYITATLQLKREQDYHKDKKRAILLLENDGTDKSAIYIRVTLCLPVPATDGNITPTIKNNQHTALTFLIACDLSDEKSQRDKVNYIYSEALEKLSENREKDLTDEERLLIQVSDDKNVFALYWGMQHYLNGRFFEAIRMLRPLWDHFNRQYNPLTEEASTLFTTLSYRLGMCYLSIGEIQKAYYYLDAVAETFHPIITLEYLNCLVNNADFRAYNIISKVEKILSEMPEDNNEKVRVSNFLLRCKVRLQIQRGHYNSAKSILKPMLDDPDSSDFAIQALSYIEQQAPNLLDEDNSSL